MGSPQKKKKIAKQKKQKKEKKEKKKKKQKKHKRDRQQPDDREMIPYKKQEYHQQVRQRQIVLASSQHKQQPMPISQNIHIKCRRCKQQTFSLKTRTCHKCGYPKQQRPKYFPATKQVKVMDLVRQGKLVHNSYAPVLIQVIANDRFGKKQRIKCSPTDTIFDFKKLISGQTGTRPQKIRLQKGNIIYKDHLSLDDYEIKDGTGLEMYYD